MSDQTERRKLQNRLNQRALRRRKALNKAAAGNPGQVDTADCVPDHWKIALSILPESSREASEPQSRFTEEQRRAVSVAIFSASALDQAKVLSPLLADSRLRQVWWTVANVLWPPLESFELHSSTNLTWTWSFTRHGLGDPLLFHAISSTAATALLMTAETDQKAMQQVVLHHETEAFSLLRRAISNGVFRPSDELLFSILLLIRSPGDDIATVDVRGPFSGFRPPLTCLQNIHIGTALSFRSSQVEMLRNMVAQRGGISEFAAPGFAEFFNFQDLFQASVRMQKPSYGLASSYQHCLDVEFPALRQKHQASTRMLFSFPVDELEESFGLLLLDMRCYLDMVDSYCKAMGSSQQPLATYRNVIQHRLLSLDSQASKPVREACRLAALLFSSVVIYPVQNPKPVHFYLDELTNVLRTECRIEDAFRCWVLVLGGMAANETPLQSWYINQLKDLVIVQARSWPDIKAVLQEFLWLDSACGEGALELWLRISSST